MAPLITTDLDLADDFSCSVGFAYREGVEFSKVLPSHSLVRFRDVLDEICVGLARLAGIDDLNDGKMSLFDKIKFLGDQRVIPREVTNAFHEARKLCNSGAHQSPKPGDSDSGAEGASPVREALIRDAEAVRSLVVSCLRHFFQKKYNADNAPDVSMASIETQEFKEILFSAATTSDPDVKYKAGLWCEGEAERRQFEFKGMIASNEFVNELTFLNRLAATFYQHTHSIRPNVDASYRYARLITLGKIDGHLEKQAVDMIAAAAKAGHGRACDHYGGILYEVKADYAGALRFWLLAVQRNAPRAYVALWSYYTEGRACEPDPAKAINYLRLGVEQGDPDCLYCLGRCYSEGLGIEENIDMARDLLGKASEMGHGYARGYLALNVNGGAEIIANQFEMLGRLMLQAANPASATRAEVRNPYALCACGSGKKYKWCCKAKDDEKKQQAKISAAARGIRLT
jgi:TPR repeat protein